MAAPVVTELTIDARGADQGSATYVRAMQAAQAAANRVIDAQSAAAAAQEKQGAVMTSGASSIGKVTAAYDKLRASLDPVAAAEIKFQSQMEKAILSTSNAVKSGVATQEQASQVISELQEKQIAGINAVRAAEEEGTAAAVLSGKAFESLKGFVLGAFTGLGAGALFAEVSQLPGKIEEAVHSAAELEHVAEATGLTTTQLQQLDYAGGQFSKTADDMNAALERFVKNLGGTGSGANQLGKVLKANGIVPTGSTMTDLDHFADLVEKASTAEQRNYLVTQAFGKGSGDLVNLFAKGSAGLKDFASQADAAGAVLDKSMLDNAMALDAEFQSLKSSSSTAFKEFAVSIAPAVLVAMKGIGAGIGLVASNFGVVRNTIEIAGAALIGYFGPSAVVMIGTFVTTTLDGLKAIGIAMLANPLGAIVAVIAAAIVAMVVFRDNIKSLIGVDVVGIMKTAANTTIGVFVGAFNGIKDTWALLPNALGDLIIQATNNVIGGVNSMLQGTVALINKFITGVNGISGKIGINLNTIDPNALKFGTVANPYQGAAQSVNDILNRASKSATGTDWIGKIAGAAGSAFSSSPLGGGTDGYGSGANTNTAKAQQSAFDKAIQSAKDDTAALVAQQQALGQTAFAADQLEEQQKLINEATQKGITLSPAQLAGIKAASVQYAQQKSLLDALTEVYNDGKQASEDFFSQLKSDLMSGTALWGSLADAASKALDDIANKALQMASDGIWNMIFGAATGGTSGGSSGGLLGSVLGILGIGGTPTVGAAAAQAWAGYATGGYTGPGGQFQPAGIVHAGEYVFDAASVRKIGLPALDAMRSMPVYAMGGFVRPIPAANYNLPTPANGNFGGITFAPVTHISGSGLSEAQLARVMAANNADLLAKFNGQFHDAVQDVQQNPRRRRNAYFVG